MIDDFDLVDWRDTDTDDRAVRRAVLVTGCLVLATFIPLAWWLSGKFN